MIRAVINREHSIETDPRVIEAISVGQEMNEEFRELERTLGVGAPHATLLDAAIGALGLRYFQDPIFELLRKGGFDI